MRNRILGTLALFVAGCGDAAFDPHRLPSCTWGQAVSFDESGAAVCVSLGAEGSQAPLPDCTQDEALVIDTLGVHCGLRSNLSGLSTILSSLNELDRLSSEITRLLGPLSPAARLFGTFVGLTTLTTRGRVADGVGNFGVGAAASACAAEYGFGSQLCTPYALHRSASLGLFRDRSLPRAWVYFPAWNYVSRLINTDRERGLGDTCNGFIYDTSADGYRGVTMQWGMLSSGSPGFTFLSGDSARCYEFLPLACCR